MAAATARTVGFVVKGYFVSTPIAGDVNEAAIEALLVSDNLIADLREIGDLSSDRPTISIPVYGESRQATVSGQVDSSTVTFGVTLDMSNTIHKSIRDDDARNDRAIILSYESSETDKTYVYLVGRLGSKTISTAIDDVVQMSFDLTINSDPEYVDNETE